MLNNKYISVKSKYVTTLFMASTIMTGCAGQAQTLVPSSVPPIVERAHVTLPPPPNKVTFLNTLGEPVQNAMLAYEKTGKAAVIETSQNITYPFGLITPTIICSPLHSCDIALKPGEQVNGVYPGDSARWAFEVASSGMDGGRQRHIILKPKQNAIATNAVITTTEHTYHINLQSDEKHSSKPTSFYYPMEVEQNWEDLKQQRAQAYNDAKKTAAENQHYFDTKKLDFNYHIKAQGTAPTWTPIRAFNDTTHVYLQLPQSANVTDLPTLFIEEGGALHLTNYRVKKPYFVIDRLFQQAVLISGVGQSQLRVTVTHQPG